jgi:putative tricarboxylic transport membrane protein
LPPWIADVMEVTMAAAWQGALLVFSWPNIIYPVVGTILAMFFAVLPGVSGVTLMALAIPLTLDWEPLQVMLLFGALVGGATYMGSITAILINIPGTAMNAATMLDGHPMARKGEAMTALGCSAAASALGSSFGVIWLVVFIPIMQWAVLKLGPMEFMMLAVWGLTTIAAVSRGSMVKGMIGAGLGLLIACIGMDPRTAELRYTFGSDYLRGGLGMIPVFLGIFAVAEVIGLMAEGRRSISGHTRLDALSGSAWAGIRSVFSNFGLFLGSCSIGSIIGMIPGVGGTVAGFVAYGQARQACAKDDHNFGKGDIRGVLAPEAANDAKDGASLIPTLSFGVPGSESAALLLAVLILHGLVPGRELMTDQLHLVFALIWSLFISNWLTSLAGLGLSRYLAWLTVARIQLVAPFIMLLATIAAYLYNGLTQDVFIMFGFGVLGYLMKKYGWPRVTLIIALVLGKFFETNLHISLRLQELGRADFWSRPIALILLVLTVACLGLPAWNSFKNRSDKS